MDGRKCAALCPMEAGRSLEETLLQNYLFLQALGTLVSGVTRSTYRRNKQICYLIKATTYKEEAISARAFRRSVRQLLRDSAA